MARDRHDDAGGTATLTPPAREQTQPLPDTGNAALRKELDALRREVAELRAAQGRPVPEKAPLPRVPPIAPPKVTYHNGQPCLGEPGPGKQLIGVELPGHKSRVVDPDRQVAVYLERVSVWAASTGEAWMMFQSYSGICGTSRTPSFELQEAVAA